MARRSFLSIAGSWMRLARMRRWGSVRRGARRLSAARLRSRCRGRLASMVACSKAGIIIAIMTDSVRLSWSIILSESPGMSLVAISSR